MQPQKILIMTSYLQIVTFCHFSNYGQLRKPDFGSIVCKTYIFINSDLSMLQKLKTELKNI